MDTYYIKPEKIMLDSKLLDIMACPICQSRLIYKRDVQELICKADRLAFPIQDGIPVMIEEEARRISLEEYDALS